MKRSDDSQPMLFGALVGRPDATAGRSEPASPGAPHAMSQFALTLLGLVVASLFFAALA